MNFHRLRLFCTVAQQRSITRAAKELMLTQPGVSLQVKALEKELGVVLFDRDRSRLRLTPAGEVLFRSAMSILNAKDEAERAIGELRDGTKGRLLFGAGTTGGMYVLPRIVSAYRRLWPETEIVFHIGTTDQILEKLHQNVLDLGVMGGPIDDRRFVAEPICTDELVLIAAPTHPLASLAEVTLKDLGGVPFIVPEAGSRTRQLVERKLREAGVPLRIAMQLPGTEGVKKAVEAGLGVGMVSRFAIQPECQADVLRAVPIADCRITRAMCLVYRNQKYFSPVGHRFREFALSFGAQHLGRPPGAPDAPGPVGPGEPATPRPERRRLGAGAPDGSRGRGVRT